MFNKLALALAVATIGMVATAASADSVYSLNTGSAPWMYVSTTSADPAAPNALAVVINPVNAGWLSPAVDIGGGVQPLLGADWIGVRSSGAGTGYYGDFTFALDIDYSDFVPPVTGTEPQSFEVSGYLSADNFVLDIYLIDSQAVAYNLALSKVYEGAPGSSQAWGFKRVFSFDDGVSLYDPFQLVVVVHNDYPPSAGADPYTGLNESPENPNNPLGFILAGEIRSVPVPLPAAVWSGMSMLGALGVGATIRRKWRRA